MGCNTSAVQYAAERDKVLRYQDHLASSCKLILLHHSTACRNRHSWDCVMQIMISLNVFKRLTITSAQPANAASICIDPSCSNKQTSYDKHSPVELTFEQPG